MGSENQMKVMSNHSVSVTLDRLSDILAEKGIGIATRVNHGAAAAKVDMELRPTELLLFGNPILGTPLMQVNQEAGFDLPMKALSWQDKDGVVWLRVTDPSMLQKDHELEGVDDVVTKMSMVLSNMVNVATAAS